MRKFDIPARVPQEIPVMTPQTEIANSELLDVLATHVPSYPTLMKFIIEDVQLPAILLSPKYVDIVRQNMHSDSDFYLETMTFIDTLTILDVMKFGVEAGTSIDTIIKALKLARVGNAGEGTVVMENIRDRSTLSRNESSSVLNLDENRELVAVYLFALVCNLYNLDTIEIGGRNVKKS